MLESNEQKVLSLIHPGEIVLDIGGWGRPFNRANWVIDAEPFDTRGYYGPSRPAQGGEREYFTQDTWIRRDICEKTPFPFKDKEIDFVICSHTLEDIRDPLWVCAEMVRIAKRGYLEIPSRLSESCRGQECGMVGWSHHRWLIDINNNHVSFLMKYHMIHSNFRFSFPASFRERLTNADCVSCLFWEDQFTFEERTIHGLDNIAAELERYVQQIAPYSALRLAIAKAGRPAGELVRRSARQYGRLFHKR